ncbi:hypothetical protein LX36DRAFT_661378 [Colletotrichum falcatum]|nr:hypothetical protein LX36DRAFT_661378 [Colletotrichum falcatum]
MSHYFSFSPKHSTHVRMSLRKTSCLSCVASKRRCDRALPACQRCSRQSLSCRYPYPPASTVDPPPLVCESSLRGLPQTPCLTFGPVDEDTAAVERTEYDDFWRYGQGPRDNDLLAPEDLSSLLDGTSSECYFGEHPAIPHTSPRHRSLENQPARLLDDTHQASTRSIPPGTLVPTNLLTNAILGPWNKFDDTATWRYCASEMLSYISLYAAHGTSPIATFTNPGSAEPNLVLGGALGVCAAHETLARTRKHVFDQLLDHELEQLATLSQSAPAYDARWQRHRSETILGEATARLQALTMYQIIRLFSDRARDFRKAAAYEALLASWTRELQLHVHMLQQHTQPPENMTIVGFGSEGTDPEILDAAHRSILMSYTVRAVHSVLNYKTCAVWNDLFTITMPTSLSGPAMLPYPEYINAWERGEIQTISEDNRRLSNLIVAACKGVDAVKSATSGEACVH